MRVKVEEEAEFSGVNREETLGIKTSMFYEETLSEMQSERSDEFNIRSYYEGSVNNNPAYSTYRANLQPSQQHDDSINQMPPFTPSFSGHLESSAIKRERTEEFTHGIKQENILGDVNIKRENIDEIETVKTEDSFENIVQIKQEPLDDVKVEKLEYSDSDSDDSIIQNNAYSTYRDNQQYFTSQQPSYSLYHGNQYFNGYQNHDYSCQYHYGYEGHDGCQKYDYHDNENEPYDLYQLCEVRKKYRPYELRGLFTQRQRQAIRYRKDELINERFPGFLCLNQKQRGKVIRNNQSIINECWNYAVDEAIKRYNKSLAEVEENKRIQMLKREMKTRERKERKMQILAEQRKKKFDEKLKTLAKLRENSNELEEQMAEMRGKLAAKRRQQITEKRGKLKENLAELNKKLTEMREEIAAKTMEHMTEKSNQIEAKRQEKLVKLEENMAELNKKLTEMRRQKNARTIEQMTEKSRNMNEKRMKEAAEQNGSIAVQAEDKTEEKSELIPKERESTEE